MIRNPYDILTIWCVTLCMGGCLRRAPGIADREQYGAQPTVAVIPGVVVGNGDAGSTPTGDGTDDGSTPTDDDISDGTTPASDGQQDPAPLELSGGADCTTATLLPTAGGSLVAALTFEEEPPRFHDCGASVPGAESHYALIALAETRWRIEMDLTADADVAMYVMDGCPLAERACSAQLFSGPTHAVATMSDSAAQRYTIILKRFSGRGSVHAEYLLTWAQQ